MRAGIGVVSLTLLVAGACSGGASGIGMRGQEFVPKTYRAKPGSTIIFKNDSDETHSVTALDEEKPEGADYFASGGFANESDARDDLGRGLIDPGGTYEVTLDQPGTYRYVCLPHESQGMTGTIIVQE
jgi:plastocyanin